MLSEVICLDNLLVYIHLHFRLKISHKLGKKNPQENHRRITERKNESNKIRNIP